MWVSGVRPRKSLPELGLAGAAGAGEMAREVASKTSDQAGDGTTTATVLAMHYLHELDACRVRSAAMTKRS